MKYIYWSYVIPILFKAFVKVNASGGIPKISKA